MADTPHEETPYQVATQTVGGEVAEHQPRPLAHESKATQKHAHDSDPHDEVPHKRYRSEPHHTVLLTNETKVEPVLSTSQYVPDFLKGTTALSIIPQEERRKIDALNSSHMVSEALAMLSKNDILSAPLFDKELKAYIGFVDYLDIASLVVDIIQNLMKEHYSDSTVASLQPEQKTKLANDAKHQFNTKKLIQITDLSKSNPFIPVQKSATLYQAMEILAKFGIHRVPIIDEEQNIEAIFSQGAVVDFLFSNLEKFSHIAKKSVSDMLSNREALTVLTIQETAPAFEAFELMIKHKVSAVGVVNEKGSLVGVISGTDMRMIGPHAGSISQLLEPVTEYLNQSRELNTVLLINVVKAALTDTLGIVVESMEDNKVHRVFVVDDEDKPLCVLSMKDVLNEFLSA